MTTCLKTGVQSLSPREDCCGAGREGCSVVTPSLSRSSDAAVGRNIARLLFEMPPDDEEVSKNLQPADG